MTAARPAAGVLATLVVAALLGCGDDREARVPPPREPTRDDIGYYCNMIVLDHPGPKAQIFLAGKKDPIWFASVRDAFAFTMLPEEPKDIVAIYVTDMARAGSWESPGPGAWIDGRSARYVIGSRRIGGMGAPAVVPFADSGDARRFAQDYGGRVVGFDQVPRAYIFPGLGTGPGAESEGGVPSAGGTPAEGGAGP